LLRLSQGTNIKGKRQKEARIRGGKGGVGKPRNKTKQQKKKQGALSGLVAEDTKWGTIRRTPPIP
jgi:hypothetical protein